MASRLVCAALSVPRKAVQGQLGPIIHPITATWMRGVPGHATFVAVGRLGGGTGRAVRELQPGSGGDAARLPVVCEASLMMRRHLHLSATPVWGGPGLRRLGKGRRGEGIAEGVRLLSGGDGGGKEEVLVFTSASEGAMKQLAVAAVGQVAVCVMMGGLLVFHPQAAASSLLPGFTFQGRVGLATGIAAFGAIFAQGTRSFLSKQILRVATLPDEPEMLHVYTLDFPWSLKCNTVPRSEFYAISAAYQDIDLEKERKESYILPMYVGGQVRQTLIIDLRGELMDLEVMHLLLTKAAKDQASKADWTDDQEPKKTFVPNRHRNSL